MATPSNFDETVTWISEIEIHDGKKDILLDMCKGLWERVAKSEPGTVVFEFYVEENDKIMWVYHRFANSEAAIKHLEDAVEFPKMMEHITYKGMRLLGSVDAKMMEILEKFNPTKFVYAGGIKPALPNRSP